MTGEEAQRYSGAAVYPLKDYSGRVPPNAVDLEVGILGGILIDPEAISVGASLLKPDAFYLPKHPRDFSCDVYTVCERNGGGPLHGGGTVKG